MSTRRHAVHQSNDVTYAIRGALCDLAYCTSLYIKIKGVPEIDANVRNRTMAAMCKDGRMAERWTRERRLEHTRGLLLDAAEESFARNGFGATPLEEIAEAAGYTRSAIYSHFGTKSELFLAVIERSRERFLGGFTDLVASLRSLDDLELDVLADRWRELSMREAGPDRAALGYEFTLFLLRNPEARERVRAQRAEAIRRLGEYITNDVARIGATLTIPADTLAHVIIATNDAVTLNCHLDDEDLYSPFLQLIVSSIVPREG
ncbi:UNVERIFIED_CONTAM: TetR family transcriptional regulator [Williamsia faeni]